jgi:hypothetical protein
MAMTHGMLRLEPGHHLHVFHPITRLEQVKPMRDGLTLLLHDGGEIRSGAFGFFWSGHGVDDALF